MGLYSDIDDFLDSSDRPRKSKPSSSQPPPPQPPPLPVWSWTNPTIWCTLGCHTATCPPSGTLLIPSLLNMGQSSCSQSFKFEYTLTANNAGTPGGVPFLCTTTNPIFNFAGCNPVVNPCGNSTTHQ